MQALLQWRGRMHDAIIAAQQAQKEPERFRDVPRYLWLVLASAFLGWMFDAADLNILTLVLAPSVGGLLGTTDPRVIGPMGGAIVGIKLAAWGIGGIVFGVVTDRIGRTRAMAI